MNLDKYLDIAKKSATSAGDEILSIYYGNDFQTEIKDDYTPVTLADKNAHNIILTYLSSTDIPIISEEGVIPDYEIRKYWDRVWIVDPLDGTKEFIKENGEFTVNIALVEKGVVILGVIYVPDEATLYWATKREGAYREYLPSREITKLSCSNISSHTTRVLCSRSHINEETKSFIDHLEDTTMVSLGSSLKFLWIADGKADIYPKLGPIMEWDTCAGQIILEEAGGKVVNLKNKLPLRYNKEDLHNPYFIAKGR